MKMQEMIAESNKRALAEKEINNSKGNKIDDFE